MFEMGDIEGETLTEDPAGELTKAPGTPGVVSEFWRSAAGRGLWLPGLT